jgi:hypothetical protein
MRASQLLPVASGASRHSITLKSLTLPYSAIWSWIRESSSLMPISERVATGVDGAREGASCLLGEGSGFMAASVCAPIDRIVCRVAAISYVRHLTKLSRVFDSSRRRALQS